MDCSTPGFPVLHYLPEFVQTHVHWVDDAIQPSHLLSPPTPTVLSLSLHQDLFEWVGALHQIARVLELQLQSFQWIFSIDILQEWLIWSLCSPRDSQESSPVTQFKNISSLALDFLHGPMLTSLHNYRKNHSFDGPDLCWQNDVSAF